MPGPAQTPRRRLRGWAARGAAVPAALLAALAGLALPLLGSCSLDYEAADIQQEPAVRVPDTVATGFVHRVVRESRLSLEVTADRAESWEADNRTVLANAAFTEFDADGKTATEGRAARVVFHADTEDAEIAGGVRVYSAAEQASLETDSLAWKSEARLLSAPAEQRVVVRKDDGSFLEGSGFVGDFRRREVSFSGHVEGSYVTSEQQEQ